MRTPEQTRQEAMGVVACIRMDLGATMTMMEHLINLVPTGPDRNAITEVSIRLASIRVELALINRTMLKADGE